MVFENLLNPVLGPIVNLPPILGIFIISLVISLIITIVYKYFTDQTMMKDIKTRQKELQKKAKEHRKEPKKAMAFQKELMDLNMKYMKQSFKPTLITFLPIIIIFGWLNANLAFEPIMPDQQFTADMIFDNQVGDVKVTVPEGVEVIDGAIKKIEDNMVQFRFKARAGDYLLIFEHDGASYDKELTITEEQRYAPVTKAFKKQPLKAITLSNDKLIPIPVTENHLGWLGTYIIFSILLSMGLRKGLKIY
ncbi:EMC3/TMCO1 family protein [Nanoarchaeota archaeon]